MNSYVQKKKAIKEADSLIVLTSVNEADSLIVLTSVNVYFIIRNTPVMNKIVIKVLILSVKVKQNDFSQYFGGSYL